MEWKKTRTNLITFAFLAIVIAIMSNLFRNNIEHRPTQSGATSLEYLENQKPEVNLSFDVHKDKHINKVNQNSQVKLLEAKEKISLLENEIQEIKDILEQPEIEGILEERTAYEEHLKMEEKTDEERWQEAKEHLDFQLDSNEPDQEKTIVLEKQFEDSFSENQNIVAFDGIKCTAELCRVNMTFPNGHNDIQLAMNHLYSIEGLVGTIIFRVDNNSNPVRASLYSIKDPMATTYN